METDSTQAMQDALKAAVAKMNAGAAPPDPKPTLMETLGPFLPMVPKLLQNISSGAEVLERLESIQKKDIAALREQVQLLRRQTHHMLKAQEQMLERVHEIQRQQVAAAGAVLDLAQQMARVTFVDDAPVDRFDDPGDDDFEIPAAPPPSYRSDVRPVRKHSNGRRPGQA